jgi:hypothetical protein
VEDSQGILARFNRLLRDLQNGASTRNCFCPWEVELLLDIESCDLGEANQRRVLQRYRRAVERRLEKGAARPLKLSEYLARSRSPDTASPVAVCGDERIPGAA